jgi:hypothetical protein
MRTIKVRRTMRYPKMTSLRSDPLYYQIYCVGLNSFFASLFPLVLLLYFNVNTLIALKGGSGSSSGGGGGGSKRGTRSTASGSSLSGGGGERHQLTGVRKKKAYKLEVKFSTEKSGGGQRNSAAAAAAVGDEECRLKEFSSGKY